MADLRLKCLYFGCVSILVFYSKFDTANASRSIEPEHYKVIILGGGMAGIAATEYLYGHGIKDILVLEGKDYIGGRIKDAKFSGNLVPLGAGWIHHTGNDNPIWLLSKKHGLKVHHDNYTDFIVR